MHVNAHARVWNSSNRPGLPSDGMLANQGSHISEIVQLMCCRAIIFKSGIDLTPATTLLGLRTEWHLGWVFIESFPQQRWKIPCLMSGEEWCGGQFIALTQALASQLEGP